MTPATLCGRSVKSEYAHPARNSKLKASHGHGDCAARRIAARAARMCPAYQIARIPTGGS